MRYQRVVNLVRFVHYLTSLNVFANASNAAGSTLKSATFDAPSS